MDMMLVAVFESEMQARRIAAAMKALAEQGAVLLYAMALVVRENEAISIVLPDGPDDSDPVLAVATRNLIEWVSQPQPLLAEEASCIVTDKIMKLATLGVETTFIDEITSRLANGKAAVVAEIEGEGTQDLDALLQASGATVLRCMRHEIMDFVIARELEALQREIETLENEAKRTSGGLTTHLMKRRRLIKLRFEAVKERSRQYSASIKQEAEAKIVLLQKRAGRTEGELRVGLERVADEVRVDYVKRAKRLNFAWQTAGGLFRLRLSPGVTQ
jgi:hypothetical protein